MRPWIAWCRCTPRVSTSSGFRKPVSQPWSELAISGSSRVRKSSVSWWCRLQTVTKQNRGGALADVVREIPGPIGRLEALLEEPRKGTPRAAVVFAHPLPTEGGTMHTKMVFQGAKGLVRTGCAVLRFNFRGVGRSRGEFGGGLGEQEDFRAAVDFMAAR